jgi:2-keto-4-pentenoate hydratase/2-oxohepta-3-ene-1,7-dioic acid hydratase in catechol pathway
VSITGLLSGSPRLFFYPNLPLRIIMTTYLFAPPAVQSVTIQGKAERFPIQRLFFVGRNYHAHAVEMGKPVD